MANAQEISNIEEVLKEYRLLKAKDEKQKQYMKQYMKNESKKSNFTANQKRWYNNHKEEKCMKSKEYYEKNKEKVAERMKLYNLKRKQEKMKITPLSIFI